jgi:hypothetical protein
MLRLVGAGSLAVVTLVACAHAQPPTVTGAQVYAQLANLSGAGRATVGAVELHRGQYLVADATSQMISQCNGEGVERDPECALALVPDLAFRVTDAMPVPHQHGDDHLSFAWKVRIAALVVAAPLTVGLIATSFPGHEAVFGVPLVLDACALLLTLGPD